MKIKLKTIAQVSALTAAVLVTNVYAALPGAYLGGQLGWGGTTLNHTVFAGRVFGGYQFDPTWAAELGWDKFSNGFNRSNTYAVDLVAKASLPLSNGFSVYGKLGAAYLNEALSSTIQLTHSAQTIVITQHKILPTFGAGVSYDISPNVTTDLSWNRIQKVGHTTMTSTNMFAVGLSYSFA